MNLCRECGVDISARYATARFCWDCSKRRQAESSKRAAEKRKAKDGAKRHPPRKCRHCKTQISRPRWVCADCSDERKARHGAVIALTSYAVRLGLLADPKTLDCCDCGAPAECYDHRDYNQPLEVEAVCMSCNNSRGAGVRRTQPLASHGASNVYGQLKPGALEGSAA